MNNSIYSMNRLKELARKSDRDYTYSPCHSEKVADYALELCRALKIRGKKKDIIVSASLVHDIGKIVIDSRIWGKKEQLTQAEWLCIMMHPVLGAHLAKEAGYSDKVVELIYYHHLWFNGSGYPDVGKKGLRIPIGARILSICDAYETMISDRPYRRTLSPEEAIEELRMYSIKQFDPKLVEAFVIEVLGWK